MNLRNLSNASNARSAKLEKILANLLRGNADRSAASRRIGGQLRSSPRPFANISSDCGITGPTGRSYDEPRSDGMVSELVKCSGAGGTNFAALRTRRSSLTQMDVTQITAKYCEPMHNVPLGLRIVSGGPRREGVSVASPQGSSSHAKANNFDASRACARRKPRQARSKCGGDC